jgi:hypothetical protein
MTYSLPVLLRKGFLLQARCHQTIFRKGLLTTSPLPPNNLQRKLFYKRPVATKRFLEKGFLQLALCYQTIFRKRLFNKAQLQ